MKWTWREGKADETPVARSSLPCPTVISDTLPEPLQHMANGRMYDSKRAMEKANRETGCVCVGNEPLTQKAVPLPPVKDDVIEAYQKVKQGYKPEPLSEACLPKESGWT